jgi:hypothetical protein
MSIAEEPKTSFLSKWSGRDMLDQVGNYFVKPKNVRGIGGFVFDYEGETSLQSVAEITDHYTEANVAIHDHIAIKPIRITLRGYAGEVVQQEPQGLVGALNLLQNKLTTVDAYLGKYTPGMIGKIQGVVTKAQNITTTIDQTLSRVNNVVGLFTGANPADTAQTKAYNWLYALQTTRQVFVVETPYGPLDNMVIETLSFIQPESTKYWSDISVTLKQLRYVEVPNTTQLFNGGRLANQATAKVTQGATKGTPDSSTLLNLSKKVFGFFK